MRDGRLSGWVIDRHRPQARVAVRFGTTAALGRIAVADFYRADVQASDLSSDGYCGFEIAPGPAYGLLYVMLSPAHTVAEVGLTPTRRAPRITRLGNRVYGMDRDGDWMSGYALDLECPNLRLELDLHRRDGGTARLIACRFDARARATPAHDGFHGFRAARAGGGRLVDAATGDLIADWSA